MGSEAEARVGGCLEVRRVVVCSVSAGLRIGGSVGVRGAVSLGELAGLRGDKGVGSGSETYPEQPAHAGRQRSSGDRHIRAGARRCVTRRRHRRVVGPIVVRHQLRGARTAVTRRHGVPGAGPVVVQRVRHGTRTFMTRQPRRRGEGMVMTRRHGVRSRATAGGRHDGASASLPGAARCSRIVLHLPLPNVRSYWAGVGGRQRGVGAFLTPRPPLHQVERGSRADSRGCGDGGDGELR